MAGFKRESGADKRTAAVDGYRYSGSLSRTSPKSDSPASTEQAIVCQCERSVLSGEYRTLFTIGGTAKTQPATKTTTGAIQLGLTRQQLIANGRRRISEILFRSASLIYRMFNRIRMTTEVECVLKTDVRVLSHCIGVFGDAVSSLFSKQSKRTV